MSRYFSKKFSNLIPYAPGEQPKDRRYLKLNTNESPFPPSEKTVKSVEDRLNRLQLYPDPESTEIIWAMAGMLKVKPGQLMITNGSDEVLNLAFMAYADENAPLVMPDITYGFYTSVADFNRIPYEEIPLGEDLTISPEDYMGIGKTIVIPNPNAPTGIALTIEEIEKIVSSNPDNIVIIDEAYVDFGAESCIQLINKYDNLIVSQTFSKSRSLAGARLGVAIANEEIIKDLNTLRFASNPYNINSLSGAIAVAAAEDNEYYMNNCKIIQENREYAAQQLKNLGFRVTDSRTNFIFAESDRISGEELYLRLKEEKGILIRHFNKERIKNFNRITIGTREQMETLITGIKELLDTIG